jgi:mycoredoxin
MSQRIRMYATKWCGDCRRARLFLEKKKIAYEELDINADPEAAKFVMKANAGKRKVPTFDVDGRVFSCSPFDAVKLSRELGL